MKEFNLSLTADMVQALKEGKSIVINLLDEDDEKRITIKITPDAGINQRSN